MARRVDAHAKEKSAATPEKVKPLPPPTADRMPAPTEGTTDATAKRVDGPRGGKYGTSLRDEEILSDPHPTTEVAELRKQAEKLYPGDVEAQLSWLRSPLQMRELRTKLLARKATAVPKVADTLSKFGVKDATPDRIGEVFKYLFDSQGIAFDYENYAAWERLASGKGSINDARFLVHELAEESGT